MTRLLPYLIVLPVVSLVVAVGVYILGLFLALFSIEATPLFNLARVFQITLAVLTLWCIGHGIFN